MWGKGMISSALQFGSNDRDRVLFYMLQEGLRSVLNGGNVFDLLAFGVVHLGKNSAKGEFPPPLFSCKLTVKKSQHSLLNMWGMY